MNQYTKHLGSLDLIGLANQLVGSIVSENGSDWERAFGSLYKWRPLKDGFEEAKFSAKPVFLLFHKLTCPACRTLKSRLTKSMRLIELSSQFVMIQVEVGKGTVGEEEEFQPDGKYVPRILFFTPDGEFIKEAYNRHLSADEKNKYFYSNPAHLLDTMLMVLKYCKKPLAVALRELMKIKLPESDEMMERASIPPTRLG